VVLSGFQGKKMYWFECVKSGRTLTMADYRRGPIFTFFRLFEQSCIGLARVSTLTRCVTFHTIRLIAYIYIYIYVINLLYSVICRNPGITFGNPRRVKAKYQVSEFCHSSVNDSVETICDICRLFYICLGLGDWWKGKWSVLVAYAISAWWLCHNSVSGGFCHFSMVTLSQLWRWAANCSMTAIDGV